MAIFLTAEWKNLLMANYTIDPKILQPYLPGKTELDTFNGEHYVSLVGFLFANTRVKGMSFPLHRNFEEVNLRFYVRYKDGIEWKRGVVFVKEIVPRRMITFIANTVYGEKYATLPMRHRWHTDDEGFHVEYEWKVRNEWNYLKAVANPQALPLQSGSEEEFITEHYWGYTKVNDRCTGEYGVQHPQWRIHTVTNFGVRCNTAVLYGKAFEEVLAQQPRSVFLAEGSAIQVLEGKKKIIV